MANGTLLGQIASGGRSDQGFARSFAQAAPIFQNISARKERTQAGLDQAEQQELTGGILEAGFAGQAIDKADLDRLGRLAPDVRLQVSEMFGIPASEDARLIGFTRSIRTANTLAQAGELDEALRFIIREQNIAKTSGADTSKTDNLIREFRDDKELAVANLLALDTNLTAAGVLPGPEEKLLGIDKATGTGFFGTGADDFRAVQAEGFPSLPKERTTQQVQSQVNTLRDAIRNTTKSFRQIEEARNRISKSGMKGTAASDISLIFNFMKMNDPGSTVREGEFATAQNAAGVSDRAINLYNRLLSGTRLSNPQRLEFIDQAESLFEAQRDAADTQIGNVLQQADQDEIGRGRVLGKDRLTAFEKRQSARASVTEAQPQAAAAATPVTSQADFDALPSGALFIEDGEQFRKP